MKKLSEIDLKILTELLRNSKVSDRKLSKKIGVSQPTVTRRRARLERDVIRNYTFVPEWVNLGFRLLAITFTKSGEARASPKNLEDALKVSEEWMEQHPNVLMCAGSRGLGMGGFMISIHRSYAEFDKFMSEHELALGKYLDDIQNVVVNLDGGRILKPLNFKYLSGYLGV